MRNQSQKFYLGSSNFEAVWNCYQAGHFEDSPFLPVIQNALVEGKDRIFRSIDLDIVEHCVDHLETKQIDLWELVRNDISLRSLLLRSAPTIGRAIHWLAFFTHQESNCYFFSVNEDPEQTTVTVYFAAPVPNVVRKNLVALPKIITSYLTADFCPELEPANILFGLSHEYDIGLEAKRPDYSQLPICVRLPSDLMKKKSESSSSDYGILAKLYKREVASLYSTFTGIFLAMERSLDSGEVVTLEGISREIGCSVASLKRRLASKNQNFRSLKQIFFRAQSALLLQTSQSITDIADRMSYSSVSSFDKAFQKTWDCTPGDFRRRFLASASASENRN